MTLVCRDVDSRRLIEGIGLCAPLSSPSAANSTSSLDDYALATSGGREEYSSRIKVLRGADARFVNSRAQ